MMQPSIIGKVNGQRYLESWFGLIKRTSLYIFIFNFVYISYALCKVKTDLSISFSEVKQDGDQVRLRYFVLLIN